VLALEALGLVLGVTVCVVGALFFFIGGPTFRRDRRR
jgi:hypothetical protein